MKNSVCLPTLWIFAVLGILNPLSAEAPALPERNVVLVTADGLRWTELFRGLDRTLLEHEEASGVADPSWLLSLGWRNSIEERREALMPFFWGTLAEKGVVLGNRDRGSSVIVENPHRFSAPGYTEILVGEPVVEIDSNDRARIQRETVLEFVRRKLNLEETEVAVFASWDVFRYFSQHQPGCIYVNAGYQEVPAALFGNSAKPELNQLQFRMKTPWDSVRHDSITAELALGFLRDHGPRLLYVALGETDDWAHERRYDRYLSSIRLFDDFLRDLWGTIESLQPYKGKTTLIVTADHGRGSELEDWTDHGQDVDDSQFIWLAALGPVTPALGDAGSGRTFTQSQVMATICALLGLDASEFNPAARGPVELLLEKEETSERRDREFDER